MRCLILLHSTTGNTAVVTRFAADRIRAAGHECTVHDIVRHPEVPALDDVDLLGVACPTMYFRPTIAMEIFIDRLPATTPARPAFLLATASGETGAHFPLLAERLRPKGWLTLGARFVPCVDNWPPHRVATGLARPLRALAAILYRYVPPLHTGLQFLWPELGEPETRHRDQITAFIAEMLARAAAPGGPAHFAPTGLGIGGLWPSRFGRWMTRDKMCAATRPRIDARLCSSCGTCVAVCPVGCISRAAEDAVPNVGSGCTGCWACYNHCPDGAISGLGCPRGAGRYAGPSPAMRELFRG